MLYLWSEQNNFFKFYRNLREINKINLFFTY
jgi:hypothetical protein